MTSEQSPTIPVFDIGGILIEWNPRHLYRQLIPDEAEMERFLATVCTHHWNVQMDAGKPFAVGVAEKIAEYPEYEHLIRAFDERWDDMVPFAFEETVAILRGFKEEGRPVYAITNFSSEKFARAQERFDFLRLFDGIIVSAIDKVLKPQPEIYRLLLDRYGLVAGDCVFMDDVEANAQGALAVGMHAIHAPTPTILRDGLRRYGLID